MPQPPGHTVGHCALVLCRLCRDEGGKHLGWEGVGGDRSVILHKHACVHVSAVPALGNTMTISQVSKCLRSMHLLCCSRRQCAGALTPTAQAITGHDWHCEDPCPILRRCMQSCVQKACTLCHCSFVHRAKCGSYNMHDCPLCTPSSSSLLTYTTRACTCLTSKRLASSPLLFWNSSNGGGSTCRTNNIQCFVHATVHQISIGS